MVAAATAVDTKPLGVQLMSRREGAGHQGAQHVKRGRTAKLARQLRAMERLAKVERLAYVPKA